MSTSNDLLKQLKDALKDAYPTDSEVITLVRQLGTLEGILASVVRQHPDVQRTVEHMVQYYQEKKAA
jgi:hypothetical protein